MTDEELLTEYLKTKNNELFDLFDQRMRPRIYKFALKHLGSNHAAAEDITQDVLVTLMTKEPIEFYPPVSDFVFAITRNLCNLYKRSENSGVRKNIKSLTPFQDQERKHGDELGFRGLIDKPQLPASDDPLLPAVKPALDTLPPLLKEAVTLCFYDNMTIAEAAKHLGNPRTTMQSRVGRGLDSLSRIITGKERPHSTCKETKYATA